MALQARTEFAAAINQIASEKGVDTSVIIDAIEQAALAAYRKDLSFRNEIIPDDFEELTAKIDSATGEIGIYRGEENVTPPGFARIAAQTAKQVIAQKLHEAEKGAILDEYEQKVGTIISGAVQRQEGSSYYIDLGRAEGILPGSEQIRDEYYGMNQRMKFFIKEIREDGRGPEVILSRTDAGLVKGLFAMEVPEIQSGAVEIKEIAREAGARTKVAVASSQEGVDPVGSMVGQKGVRVQQVINELGDEKIDIISYSSEPVRFIAAALSPAKDVQVTLNEEEKTAVVKIPDAQLSLAIGKGGQNVRLAAKLTGWKIDIQGLGDAAPIVPVDDVVASTDDTTTPVVDDSAVAEEDNSRLDEVAGVEAVEEEIDRATVEEAGETQPEPSEEKQAETVAVAEDDIAEADKEDAEAEKQTEEPSGDNKEENV